MIALTQLELNLLDGLFPEEAPQDQSGLGSYSTSSY
jgi:hypothetical protein